MKGNFKYIVIGMGIQGSKRAKIDKKNFVGYVDPFNKKANYKNILDVPIEIYNSAYVCTPDKNKINIIKFLLKNKKNTLVEKPLLAIKNNTIKELYNLAEKNKVILYTAYNHRFEPYLKKVKELIKSKIIGKVYVCNIFYGNGTSMLVRKSLWKDKNNGVITDLGSHLLDLINYLFPLKKINFFKLTDVQKFENISPDYAKITYGEKNFQINLEMTYCMWKNSFYLDILGEKGSIHMNCLCKWGPSKLIVRKRKKPSGIPVSKKYLLKIKDPTWKEEHEYFKKKVLSKNKKNNQKKDLWINQILNLIIKKWK
jgi:scyllo-inositol 2-dehydrogenase (NADP+)